MIDGTNDTLQLSIDGNPFTLTLAHGTYNATQLAAAVQAAATTAGAPLTASIDAIGQAPTRNDATKAAPRRCRSPAATRSPRSSLSTDGAPLTGIDGKVQVDGGAVQTFTSITPGQTVTLNAPTGTISAVFSGGLRTGTLNATNVSTGDGSLADGRRTRSTAPNTGVIASAVQVGANQWRLQLTSATTGVLHDLNVAASEFGAGAGGLVSVNAAADAQLTVGTGPGAFTVTSGSNIVSGLLAGVTLTLLGTTTDPVTVSTARDADGLADKVQALVDAANQLHQTIGSTTSYDPDTNTAQALTGDLTARQLANSLAAALEDAVERERARESRPRRDLGRQGRQLHVRPHDVPRRVQRQPDRRRARCSRRAARRRTPTSRSSRPPTPRRAAAYDVNVTQLATQATVDRA